MKKSITLFMLMLTATLAYAASYPIYVMGTQVTDANKNNITYDSSVSYQPETNTLTLSSASLTYAGSVIRVTSDMTKDFKINFMNSNKITAEKGCGIYYEGKGKLILYSEAGYDRSNTITSKESGCNGIDIINGADIQIQRLDLTVNGGSTGIGTHLAPKTEILEIDKSNVNIHGGKSAVKMKQVVLKDVSYIEGYAINGYNSEGRGTYNNTVKADIKTKVDEYNISVANVNVNAKNAYNILADKAKSVSYDPQTNELTLNNAYIDTHATNAIFVNNSHGQQFKLNLTGHSIIVHTGSSSAVYLHALTDMPALVYSSTGSGILSIESGSVYAPLHCGKNAITIKDCTVSLKATNNQAVAFKGNGSTAYSFNNANFTAETAGSNVCADVSSLAFTNCFMQTPTDGFINNKNQLASGGSTNKLVIVQGKDNIKPNFYYGDELTASDITAYSAKISYKMAMDNKTPYKNLIYHVDVRKESSTGKLIQSYDLKPSFASSSLSSIIGELEPESKYNVSIRVTDEDGNRNTYKDVLFTTKKNAQPTLPTNKSLTCKAAAKSIEVKWNAASDDWTAADKLLYIVEYKVKGTSGWYRPEAGNATSYTITSLQPNTTYLVNVCVKDQSGLYNRYQETEVKTLADTDAVETITTDAVENVKIYNLQGVEVGAEYKGIVIINGKKQILK